MLMPSGRCTSRTQSQTVAEPRVNGALVSHMITAKHAAPFMIRAKSGLIVQVTDGDMLGAGGNGVTGTVKGAITLFAYMLAEELRPHGVAALAITPGFLRSEMMLEHFGVTEETWRDGAKKDPHFLESETPLFLGRAVAALAADPDLMAHSGDLTSSWELSREYEFTDANGERPDWGEHFEKIAMTIPMLRDGLPRWVGWLERIQDRAKRYIGSA